jgi:hypothetical protein
MPGDPKECRAHAVRCEELARVAPTPEARQHFLDLSGTWKSLAADLEATQAFLNAIEALELEPTNVLPLRQTG